MLESQYDSIKELCYKNYSRRNLAHVLKVEEYIMNEGLYALVPEDMQFQLRAVALGHDLLEDTKCTLQSIKDIDPACAQQILSLTKTNDTDYLDYINFIFSDLNDMVVKMVKICDMKDHLARKETLTEKLERKYKPAVEVIYHYFFKGVS